MQFLICEKCVKQGCAGIEIRGLASCHVNRSRFDRLTWGRGATIILCLKAPIRCNGSKIFETGKNHRKIEFVAPSNAELDGKQTHTKCSPHM